MLCIGLSNKQEMRIIEKRSELLQLIEDYKKSDKTIGLVPTMGALHEGHVSLVRQAKQDNDLCVVSVFVNPTQFNNKEDLDKYPRDIARDARLLETEGADIVFAPTVEEVYPEPDTRQFDFGQLDKVMEGKFRPGHFNGVAQVVSRLFDIVKPDRAYFGEKDFQQLAIIRAMVKQLELNIQIVPMPIVRESSGLALSSRNERLSTEEKEIATNIYKGLLKSKNEWHNHQTVKETVENVIEYINSFDKLNVEYFQIVDGDSLQEINDWSDSQHIVGCITVFCGDVRLIDNIIYKK